MIVDELRRRARREGFEKLCAFTHAPRLLHPHGLLDRAAPLADREVFTDCVKCPQFRQCGQYAMVVPLDAAFDAERGYGLPAAAAARAARVDDRHASSTHRRRRHDAARLSRRRRQRRHQSERRASISRCSSSDTPAHGGRGLHDQPGAGGAGARLAASTSRARAASARAIVVNSGCANACTGDDGLRDARDMAAETARARRLPGRAGAGRVDRRDRRRAADGQDPQRPAGRVRARSAPIRARRRRARS